MSNLYAVLAAASAIAGITWTVEAEVGCDLSQSIRTPAS